MSKTMEFYLTRGKYRYYFVYLINNIAFYLFLKNGPTPAYFSLILSFQIHITIFITNKCEKMSIQYTVLGLELTTFGT